MVVTPFFTFVQPSVRSVRIPSLIECAAIVDDAARLKISGRNDSFSTSNS